MLARRVAKQAVQLAEDIGARDFVTRLWRGDLDKPGAS